MREGRRMREGGVWSQELVLNDPVKRGKKKYISLLSLTNDHNFGF